MYQLPQRTTFEVGEALDLSGLVLRLAYNDGTSETVTEGYTVSGFDSALGGVKTVAVTYQGCACSFEAEVVKRLSSSRIDSMPTKEVYALNEAPDLTGISVTLTYNDGTTETVTEGFEIEDFDTSEAGEYSALIIFGPFMTFYDYIVDGSLPPVSTDALVGDVNGDEEITDADAIYLLYHTFYPDEYPIEGECDFNGDGELTDADAIYLLYYTFYPDEYPLALPPKKED